MKGSATNHALHVLGLFLQRAARVLVPASLAAKASAISLTVLLAAGCAAPAVAPPFHWEPSFASAGKSLTLRELSREATPEGTLVRYRIESTGFTGPEAPLLWWKRGQEYGRFAVAVSTSGVVLLRPDTDVFAISEFVSGEPLDLALVSADAGGRAQAKVVPFPIEAQGPGGCSASAEIQSETGDLFSISLRGFVAGESVHVESRLGETVRALDLVASPQGELQFPLRFDPADTGETTLTAAGRSASVTLTYSVGKSAIVVR